MREITRADYQATVREREALRARIAELEQQARVSDEMYEAQWKKFEDCPHSFGGDTHHLCACSLDHLSDVCAVHAPKLKAALAKITELEKENGRLKAPLTEDARKAKQKEQV